MITTYKIDIMHALSEIKSYFVENLFASIGVLISTSAPSGLTISKLIASFKIGVLFSLVPILGGFTSWINNNFVYINLVVIAVFLDWILGSLKHWLWLNDFHWKENIKGVTIKLLLVLIVGFVVEGMKYLSLDYGSIALNIMMVLRMTVFMYPASSIIRSSRILSDGRFPSAKIYKAIEDWNEALITKVKNRE